MNNSAEDIKDLLVAANIGLVFKTNLFIGVEPVLPANCTTVKDTEGYKPDTTLDVATIYHSSIQICVRNTDYEIGWALIQVISDTLHGRANETWNGTMYLKILLASGPVPLEWDENNRIRFSVNFDITRRK